MRQHRNMTQTQTVKRVRIRRQEHRRPRRSAHAGQSMVEYAIVAALIAVVAMAAVQGLGSGIAGVFQRLVNHIQGIG